MSHTNKNMPASTNHQSPATDHRPPKTIYAVIPTYNESENLQRLVERLLSLPLDGLHILIVDDASPDGTGELADRLAASHPQQVQVLHRQGRLGLGSAYLEGFARVLEAGADYVIQMDADFSHDPDKIPEMFRSLDGKDVVFGSRYVDGGSLDERWGLRRRFLSWWANRVWVGLLLGIKTRDATTGFRCWRAGALHSIRLDQIRCSGYAFLIEMCYIAEKMGLRIHEVPIYFRDRSIGRSKMSLSIQLEAALRVPQMRFRYRKLGDGGWRSVAGGR